MDIYDVLLKFYTKRTNSLETRYFHYTVDRNKKQDKQNVTQHILTCASIGYVHILHMLKYVPKIGFMYVFMYV